MEEINEKQIEDLRSLKDKYISDGNITYRVVQAAPRGVMALPLDAEAEVADLWDKRSDGYRPAERLYPKDFHTGKYSLLSDAEAKAAVDRYHAAVERLDGEMQREYTGAQKPVAYYAQVAYIDSGEDREILDRYVEKEDYSSLLSDAEDYASADDYEFDLADTFKNGPAHYPGDSLIASNGTIAVVQNRIGDYAVFFKTDKSQIKENLYNDKRGRYAVNDDFTLDYEHEWSDDVKEIIEEMRNERREKTLVKRLGEGFHWKAETPYDVIEIGVEERLDDRITGIDVENGHLKLHGDTATAGGPDAHIITTGALSVADWRRLNSFVGNIRAETMEQELLRKLKEGFHWSAESVEKGIRIDDIDDDYITGIYVEDGQLKLRGQRPYELNSHNIPLEYLSGDLWRKVEEISQAASDRELYSDQAGEIIGALREMFAKGESTPSSENRSYIDSLETSTLRGSGGKAYSFTLVAPNKDPKIEPLGVDAVFFDDAGKYHNTLRFYHQDDDTAFTDIALSDADTAILKKGFELAVPEHRAFRFEEAAVNLLGENYHWEARQPSDAIEIGVEERLDDRITGIDVENGHLKLHGNTATAGGPDAHDITVTSLSKDDMSKIYDFAMDYRRDKVLNDPTYRPVKKVWDVIGQKGSEYETIKSGLTDKAATNFVARHTADYGRKGYDTIYSVPTYIIDRRYKGVSIPSSGRWHGEKQKEWKVGAGFRENLAAIESKGVVSGTPVKDGKIKIPQDYFYPDRHAAVSAILSAEAMNHDYGLVEYYDLEDIYHSGLRIKEDAQPVYIPDYRGDEAIGVKEVYPAEMTDFAEKAVIDDSYRMRFHNTIINSMNRREDTFPVRQLAFLNKDGGLDVSDRDKAVKDLETIDARFNRYLSGESVEEEKSQAGTQNISLSDQDEVSKENEQKDSQERERPRGLHL